MVKIVEIKSHDTRNGKIKLPVLKKVLTKGEEII